MAAAAAAAAAVVCFLAASCVVSNSRLGEEPTRTRSGGQRTIESVVQEEERVRTLTDQSAKNPAAAHELPASQVVEIL
jgi:hypothetical protein